MSYELWVMSYFIYLSTALACRAGRYMEINQHDSFSLQMQSNHFELQG